MKLVYIAHALGTGPGRATNLALATRWCAWAAEQGVIPCAPWIAIATHWPETRREEGLAIDFETIERCDEVWLCGPRVSTGMALEASHAWNFKKPVWIVEFMTERVEKRRWL